MKHAITLVALLFTVACGQEDGGQSKGAKSSKSEDAGKEEGEVYTDEPSEPINSKVEDEGDEGEAKGNDEEEKEEEEEKEKEDEEEDEAKDKDKNEGGLFACLSGVLSSSGDISSYASMRDPKQIIAAAQTAAGTLATTAGCDDLGGLLGILGKLK